uniref:F-box domain-containing protein n=1 Tax=Meloidogyne enterolobii TaxID=390850 RepID=A0A6V7WF51_MELEN|nr:unnamed protein product [Meloidogyne enterolobii]
MSPETLILDNGCFNIKIGYAGSNSRLFPNAIIKSKFDKKRIYIADEIEQLSDKTSLYFSLPIERGYLVNWDTQLQIWNKLFGKDILNVDYKNCRIILTDPSDISRAFSEDNTEEIIFENYCFHSLIRTSAPSLTAQIHCSFENPCCIIVDSGHSFTHIVPYIQGKIAKNGVLRIDVGGKALTNQLKDWISYRQLNVTDETYVINCCKEDVCFVSTDFQEDMKNWRAKRLDYLLPDFVTLMRGEIFNPKSSILSQKHLNTQKLSLGVERFALTELLFNPSDVEIGQMGIVEAINNCLSKFPKEIQLLMAANIVLIGGNSLFAGYLERILTDLRCSVDETFPLEVLLAPNPIAHAWNCANNIFSNKSGESFDTWNFASKTVTRSEYEENGLNICQKLNISVKFSSKKMFYSLPTETKLDIFKFLSYKELRSINQTNLYFYEFINKFQGELAREKFNEINIDYFKQFKGPRRYLVTLKTANFDFPLDKEFEKKWRVGLEKRISLYLPVKDLDKDIVICLTKGGC